MSGVTICGIKRGQQLGQMRIWREQANNRQRIGFLPVSAGLAIGRQARALVGGDERGHRYVH